jgi:hypothetical protein
MASVIYGLCASTAFLCAWLLLRAYWGGENTLLFWSGVFFSIQTLNNIFLIIDKLVIPDIDVDIWRHTIALLAILLLLYGLIMRTEVD